MSDSTMVAKPVSPRPLAPRRRRTLKAAVARILPTGEMPGAEDTGVAGAVEQALAQPYFHSIRQHMLAGLDGLDQSAIDHHARGFADCEEVEQDALLRDAQANQHWTARLFFRFLVQQTLEGFLGDPRHGGNRGALGWRSLGYEPSHVRDGLCWLMDPEEES